MLILKVAFFYFDIFLLLLTGLTIKVYFKPFKLTLINNSTRIFFVREFHIVPHKFMLGGKESKNSIIQHFIA